MDKEKFLESMRDKAKFYSKELWGIEFDGEIKLNNRLRSTYAQYCWFNQNKIEFNKQLINIDSLFVDEVLIHELCHWHCHKTGLEFDDGDFDFELEIFKSGSRSTETDEVRNNGEVWLLDDESWYYCDKCSEKKESYRIKKNERINHYGTRREEARPICPICGDKLSYYCETNFHNRWVNYYPRKRLKNLNEKYNVLINN